MRDTPDDRELDDLRRRIGDGLRAFLRHDRRRLDPFEGDAAATDAEEEEAKLKEFERDLERRETILKGRPPDEGEVGEFEDGLKALQLALKTFEDKLHDLGVPKFPAPDDAFRTLVESFEDLLRGDERLLESFEDLLRRFQPTPVGLLTSFEDLLGKLVDLLLSFDWLVRRWLSPPQALLESLEELLKGFLKLLGSFETLVKQSHPTNRSFILSFEELLGSQFGRPLTALLKGFAERVSFGENEQGQMRLLDSLIGLLEGLGELLKSFEDLLEGIPPDATLAKSFEGRLEDYGELLGELEKALKDVAPKARGPLLRFEALLRRLEELLASFEDLLRRFAIPPRDLVRSFESLLRALEELLESFEDLVRGVPEEDLIRSFESLLHRLAELLESFQRFVPLDDEDLKSSRDALWQKYQRLVGSLEELKRRLPELPPDLQQSNPQVLDQLLGLQERAFEQRGSGSWTQVVEDIDAVIETGKLLYDLAELLGRQSRLDRTAVEMVARLVPRHRGLVDACERLTRQMERPPGMVTDALEDARWVHERVAERVRRLTGGM